MRLTIALDPGLRASGLAVFEGAVLKHAAIVRPEIHHRETLPAVVVMCEGLVQIATLSSATNATKITLHTGMRCGKNTIRVKAFDDR